MSRWHVNEGHGPPDPQVLHGLPRIGECPKVRCRGLRWGHAARYRAAAARLHQRPGVDVALPGVAGRARVPGGGQGATRGGGRGPAADYSLAALAADNLAMGDHDLVVGHSMGGATATLAAARRSEWAGRLVLV